MHALKGLVCRVGITAASSRASPYSSEAFAAAPALFAQLLFNAMRGKVTAGYLGFHPMAQCVVHALKGLACRAPVLLAHAEATKNIIYFQMGPKLRHPPVQNAYH